MRKVPLLSLYCCLCALSVFFGSLTLGKPYHQLGEVRVVRNRSFLPLAMGMNLEAEPQQTLQMEMAVSLAYSLQSHR